MVLGDRDRERFWIALTVRLAFGLLFLIAAINIFFSDWNPNLAENRFSNALENARANVRTFVDGLSKPYETSWVNLKIQRGPIDTSTGAPSEEPLQLGLEAVRIFLYAMPFIFAGLSFFLLTGLFLRPALRFAAIFLVLLGLGKYLTDFRSGNTLTTLQDFLYAMFITLALFVLSKEKGEPAGGDIH